MKMICNHCQRIFNDDDMNSHYGYIDYSYREYKTCPYCDSEEVEEVEEIDHVDWEGKRNGFTSKI